MSYCEYYCDCHHLSPVQFFVLHCFSSSVFLFFLWCGRWWGMFLFYCCCLFSCIVYSLNLNVSDQVRADTAPAWGGGLPAIDIDWVLPSDCKVFIFFALYLVWIPLLFCLLFFIFLFWEIAVLYYIAMLFPLQAFLCCVWYVKKKKAINKNFK